jgi:hypothetical protein
VSVSEDSYLSTCLKCLSSTFSGTWVRYDTIWPLFQGVYSRLRIISHHLLTSSTSFPSLSGRQCRYMGRRDVSPTGAGRFLGMDEAGVRLCEDSLKLKGGPVKAEL